METISKIRLIACIYQCIVFLNLIVIIHYIDFLVREKTGLTISKPQLCGIKNWYDDKDYRYVVLFYKTEHFSGELQSSDEGKVWWEDFDNLSHLKLATDDMSDMLRVFLEEDLSEFFYYKDGDDWFYDLK